MVEATLMGKLIWVKVGYSVASYLIKQGLQSIESKIKEVLRS